MAGNALNRGERERLTEDPIVRFPICVVASAGSGLESKPVKNRDIAAAVMDQTALLQRSRRLGDADSADAEHQGQDFVRDTEGARVRAILGHQQPAGKPLLDHMKARAGRFLGELAQMDEDIAVNLALQRPAASEFATE